MTDPNEKPPFVPMSDDEIREWIELVTRPLEPTAPDERGNLDDDE